MGVKRVTTQATGLAPATLSITTRHSAAELRLNDLDGIRTRNLRLERAAI